MTTPIHGGMPCDPLTVEELEPEPMPARRRSGLVAALCILAALALVALPLIVRWTR